MESYLMKLDLWDIVEAATKPPTPEDEAIAFKDWSKKNGLAIYLIWESFGPDAFPLIGKISTTKIAQDALAEKYKPKSKASLLMCENISTANDVDLKNVEVAIFRAIKEGNFDKIIND